MDSFILGEDIPVVCLSANGFPDGITAAHQQLHEKINLEGRRIFGISKPYESGVIRYKAAVEALSTDEAASLGLESFTIPGGSYNTYYIKDYRNNLAGISECFQLLLGQSETDPKSWCIEWYIGDNDLKCMVRCNDKDYPVEHHL